MATDASGALRGRSAGWALLWAVVGGLLAYLLDPQLGRRRRALAGDRAGKTARRLARIAPRKAAYAGGRLRGAAHGAAHVADAALGGPAPEMPDTSQYLAQKVSTELGRMPDLPRERLNVDAVDGVVHLRGRLDTSEQVTAVVERVRKIAGVRDVVSHLGVKD